MFNQCGLIGHWANFGGVLLQKSGNPAQSYSTAGDEPHALYKQK